MRTPERRGGRRTVSNRLGKFETVASAVHQSTQAAGAAPRAQEFCQRVPPRDRVPLRVDHDCSSPTRGGPAAAAAAATRDAMARGGRGGRSGGDCASGGGNGHRHRGAVATSVCIKYVAAKLKRGRREHACDNAPRVRESSVLASPGRSQRPFVRRCRAPHQGHRARGHAAYKSRRALRRFYSFAASCNMWLRSRAHRRDDRVRTRARVGGSADGNDHETRAGDCCGV